MRKPPMSKYLGSHLLVRDGRIEPFPWELALLQRLLEIVPKLHDAGRPRLRGLEDVHPGLNPWCSEVVLARQL